MKPFSLILTIGIFLLPSSVSARERTKQEPVASQYFLWGANRYGEGQDSVLFVVSLKVPYLKGNEQRSYTFRLTPEDAACQDSSYVHTMDLTGSRRAKQWFRQQKRTNSNYQKTKRQKFRVRRHRFIHLQWTLRTGFVADWMDQPLRVAITEARSAAIGEPNQELGNGYAESNVKID